MKTATTSPAVSRKPNTALLTKSSERKLLFPQPTAPHCSKDAARFTTSGGAA